MTMQEQARSRSLLSRVGARLGAQLRSNIGGIVGTVLLLGGLGAGLFYLSGMTPRASGQGQTDQAASFMQALKSHDGTALAETLSPSYRARLAVQTGAVSNTNAERARLNALAERASIDNFREVAAVPLKQGGAVHLFVTTATDPSGGQVEIPYTVTVSPDGLVDRVE
jgi:hypothetical protein